MRDRPDLDYQLDLIEAHERAETPWAADEETQRLARSAYWVDRYQTDREIREREWLGLR